MSAAAESAPLRRSMLLPAGIALFALGLAATLVIFGLYVAGFRELPVWLNLLALGAPIGLLLGILSAFRSQRHSR